LSTDLINEYFGETSKAIITACLSPTLFVIIYGSKSISQQATVSYLTINLMAFWKGLWIIVGSITAFMVSQLDVLFFISKKTKRQQNDLAA
jgi:uncharacterized PurR-regulated membrane protein YhhQ (DUF165 family)